MGGMFSAHKYESSTGHTSYLPFLYATAFFIPEFCARKVTCGNQYFKYPQYWFIMFDCKAKKNREFKHIYGILAISNRSRDSIFGVLVEILCVLVGVFCVKG